MVPYVDAVVTMNVMRTLLFVLDVCKLRECERDGVWDGGVVVVSVGHVCGTRGSGSVSSAAYVLGMSVVHV